MQTTIHYNCCYCGANVEQRVTSVINMHLLRQSSKCIHAFDEQDLANLTECPSCGYVSYDLKKPLIGLSCDTIVKVNKEALEIMSSIDCLERNRKHILNNIKYFLFLCHSLKEYEVFESILNDMARCLYRLRKYDALPEVFIDEFKQLYINSKIDNIFILELLRTFGCFTFVLDRLQACDDKTITPLMMLEKEYCKKTIDQPILKDDLSWIKDNGFNNEFSKCCFFCGENIRFFSYEYVNKCECCKSVNNRRDNHCFLQQHGSPE